MAAKKLPDQFLFSLENRVLGLVDKAKQPITEEELLTTLADRAEKKTVQKAIASLTDQEFIKHLETGYCLSNRAPLFRGILTQNLRGFGFVAIDGIGSRKAEQKDPYIPKGEMHGAIHGDRVLVRLLPHGRRDRGRPDYTVIRIVEAAPDILCGILREKRDSFLVVPDNPQIPFKIQINADELAGARPGDVVRVRFQRDNATERSRPGQILAVLGSPALIDTQMQLAIEKFELPDQFSPAVISYAKKLSMADPGTLPRKDLRQTMHITIDGAGAKDFDDAICIEELDRGMLRLFVSIADVSHFVKTGSALDSEAYQRGTSVYFPGRVIPMLPEKLSNELCSLVPEQDRYTVTAQLDFDPDGKMLRTEFYRSIIKSKQRFTYSTVSRLLTAGEKPEKQQGKFLPMLQQAEKLAQALRQRRRMRGAIDFNLREAVFTLDNKGEVASIKAAERNLAHRMIEEFMLVANEAVAEFLTGRISRPVFRIHEQPSAVKVKDFQDVASRLGLNLPRYHKEPSWFSEVLKQVRETKYEYIVNTLLLRSLTQAQYATDQKGHFGLASPAYTHFTSPIRRYPDLIVHRMLTALLEANGKKSRKQKFAPQPAEEAATFLSSRERIAIDAERDMNDRLKVSYMKDKRGETFWATISGVTENALFIELEEPMVSGAIPVEMLGNDYFFYDEQRFRLFGEISRKEYQLGDRIAVRLVDISMGRRQLTFQPEEVEQ